ncbi:major capsid protein [Nocardia sp. SC052]|uniref:major capsid protein n=1 Tax=Nocardia sichangensis TaxID=3385975 RepID=UPI0039A09CBD
MANSPYNQEYPFGPPTVSGNSITVDLMLKEPTRINTYVSDTALVDYFADRIFVNGGGVSGGALLYTQATKNDILPVRRAQEIAPGAEFPEVTFDRPAPLTAQVKKLGGRYPVTDEARDRNDLSVIQTETTKLGNDVRDQIHQRAIAELEASITAIGSAVQITGVSWADATALSMTTSTPAARPAADFVKAKKVMKGFGLGAVPTLWIVNPQEEMNFQTVYGDTWQSVLATWKVDMVSSDLVAAGTAYALQERGVGQVRFEQELRTVTYREESRESTWVQTSVRPVFAVTHPYSVLKVTGLDA